jgi:hypothetical protein
MTVSVVVRTSSWRPEANFRNFTLATTCNLHNVMTRGLKRDYFFLPTCWEIQHSHTTRTIKHPTEFTPTISKRQASFNFGNPTKHTWFLSEMWDTPQCLNRSDITMTCLKHRQTWPPSLFVTPLVPVRNTPYPPPPSLHFYNLQSSYYIMRHYNFACGIKIIRT